MTQPILRFAPSPNGLLHLGHALSALVSQRMARRLNGILLLRFDDNDRARARRDYERQIIDDLTWLGISWHGEPVRLSQARSATDAALSRLDLEGMTYAARLSRQDVRQIAEQHRCTTAEEWPRDPDGAFLYPGPAYEKVTNAPPAIRMNLKAALRLLATADVHWREFSDDIAHITTQNRSITAWGDVLLRGKSGDDSYAFATVVQDAALGVSHIVRGADLLENTCAQRFLQNLLGLPAPLYYHHRLICDETGRKLSKSEGALSLQSLRSGGATRADVIGLIDEI